MKPETYAHLNKIFERYHNDGKDWPSDSQIAFDIGWMTGVILDLDRQLEGWLSGLKRPT